MKSFLPLRNYGTDVRFSGNYGNMSDAFGKICVNGRSTNYQNLDFFYLSFAARQDYFTHFEPGRVNREVGRKREIREKPSDYPQTELGLSHM